MHVKEIAGPCTWQIAGLVLPHRHHRHQGQRHWHQGLCCCCPQTPVRTLQDKFPEMSLPDPAWPVTGVEPLAAERPDLGSPQGQPSPGFGLTQPQYQTGPPREGLNSARNSGVLKLWYRQKSHKLSSFKDFLTNHYVLRTGFWLANNSGDKTPHLRYVAFFSKAHFKMPPSQATYRAQPPHPLWSMEKLKDLR